MKRHSKRAYSGGDEGREQRAATSRARVHQPGEVTFALLASRSPRMPRSGNFRDLRTPFPATATRPRVRNILLPGEGWRGTFSGVGRLPRGAYLRVLFGLFAPPGEPGKRFAVVTTRRVRLP
jgi:hypothetical protein